MRTATLRPNRLAIIFVLQQVRLLQLHLDRSLHPLMDILLQLLVQHLLLHLRPAGSGGGQDQHLLRGGALRGGGTVHADLLGGPQRHLSGGAGHHAGGHLLRRHGRQRIGKKIPGRHGLPGILLSPQC